jgi:hypothetical protein
MAEHGGALAISGDGKPGQARLHLYGYLGRSRVRIGLAGVPVKHGRVHGSTVA